MAIDPQDKNLNDLTKNSESASKSAKNAANAANRAAKSAKEAAESSKQSASFTEESSKTVSNLVSENSSAIRNLITTVREENRRIETQKTEIDTNQETSESETPKSETKPVVDAISTLLPNLNSYINAQSGVLDAMENDLNYQKESLVLFGGMDKVNKKLLDAEIEANKSQKIALLKQEQILLDQLAEFEKMREELSPEDQLKVQKQLSDAITNLSKKKEEVKSRGEELEEARGETNFFKKIKNTFKDLAKLIGDPKEKISLLSQIGLGVFLLGLAIQRGLVSTETIGKILGFLLKMIWEGIKVVTSIVSKLIYMAVDGFFSWLESTFIGSLIKGFGVLGGVLNIFKIFGKLSGPLAALSTGINYVFGVMGKIIGYVFKMLSFLPTIGNFFSPIVKFFGFIGKFAPLAKAIPGLGQILTIVFAVVDAIRGFVRGFSGPDGSFMKGLRGALSMIISGLTFGLLDFDIVDGFLADFFGAIGDFFVFLWDNISAYYTFLWNVIKAPFVAIGEFFSDFWKIIWDSDKTLMEKIRAIFDAWMSAISNMFANIWEAIKNFGSTLVGIWEPITQFFMDIGPMIWDYVKKIPGLLFDGLKFMFMDFPMMIWDGIKSIFSSIFSAAKDIFGTAVSWISDTIFSLVKSVGNIGKAIWNSLMGLVKGVLKAILDYVPDWAIPQSVYDFVYGSGDSSGGENSGGKKGSSPMEQVANDVSGVFASEMSKVTDGISRVFGEMHTILAGLVGGDVQKEEEKGFFSKLNESVASTLGIPLDEFDNMSPEMQAIAHSEAADAYASQKVAERNKNFRMQVDPQIVAMQHAEYKRQYQDFQKAQREQEQQQQQIAITNTNNNVVNNNYAGETTIRPTKAIDPSSSRLRSRHTI